MVSRSGTYIVSTIDEEGCQAQLELDLNIHNEGPGDILTPNEDGQNDNLTFPELRINPELYPNAQLTIINRWGQVIYQDDQYRNNWNGITQSGKPVPEGTYYYNVALDVFKGPYYKGSVLVLR